MRLTKARASTAEVRVRERKDSGCQPGFKLGDSVAEGSKSRKHWAGALWEEDEE